MFFIHFIQHKHLIDIVINEFINNLVVNNVMDYFRMKPIRKQLPPRVKRR